MGILAQIARRYRGGRERLFILHGNVMDLTEGPGGELQTLPRLLLAEAQEQDPEGTKRRNWAHYDLAFGARWLNELDAKSHARIATLLGEFEGGRATAHQKPIEFVRMLESLALRREKIGEKPNVREVPFPLRVIITDAHLIVPDGATALLRDEERQLLVLLKRFATHPQYDGADALVVLATDACSGLHRELREVAVTIEVPRPPEAEIGEFALRAIDRAFASLRSRDPTFVAADPVTLPRMLRLAVGLTRRQVENICVEHAEAGQPLTVDALSTRREELIRRDYGDFLEFLEPSWTLDDVGGSAEAVAELRALADALKHGDRDVPSGIILAGQNGIGKTFLAKGFAGSAGATVVVLKPIQDKYLGESEKNWDKVETALRSAGQVIVLVDEADAQMGQRTGDAHEVSKRLFVRQMQLMGDPAMRGRILWVLMTCRPDKLAPDVKRPGRCERVIPLFPLANTDDAWAMLRAVRGRLAREGYAFADAFLRDERPPDSFLAKVIGKTGAQVERLLRRAKKRAAGAPIGLEAVDAVATKETELASEPEAYELQRLVAVAEAIETENEDLIPKVFRDQVLTTYESVDGMKERIDELRGRLDRS